MINLLKIENSNTFKNKKEIYAMFNKQGSIIRRALLPIDDKRAIWCGSLNDNDSKWKNQFKDSEETLFTMSNDNEKQFAKGKATSRDYDLVVFTKIDGEYQFKGVFEHVKTSNNTIEYKRVKTYISVYAKHVRISILDWFSYSTSPHKRYVSVK